MAFRDYKSVEPLCVVRETPLALEEALKELQEAFDFIDLQFSTHYDPSYKQERFCALLLVKSKES